MMTKSVSMLTLYICPTEDLFVALLCADGVTNSVAMTSGVLSASLNGHLLGAHPTAGDWRRVFTISAGIQVVGGLLWWAAASGRKQKWG